MNVNKMPVNNTAKLSMFMMNLSAKLLVPLRLEHAEFSFLDFKTGYLGVKYLHETLKIFPQKPGVIVIDEITGRLDSIRAIHQTFCQIKR